MTEKTVEKEEEVEEEAEVVYEGEATAARAVTSIAILAPRNGLRRIRTPGPVRAAMDAPLAHSVPPSPSPSIREGSRLLSPLLLPRESAC